METYFDYLRAMAPELGSRIVETYPALQSPKDEPAPRLNSLLRSPLPAQALAITGLAKYLKTARAARIVAECGAGKTFMSLGTIHVHAGDKPYTSIVMCPPHIVHKWAREALLTVPNARAFIIEDLRNGGDPKNTHGIVEVKLEKGKTVVRGLTTTLPKLRSMGRAGWRALCPGPAFFIMGKEKGKLGYFWKHAFSVARSGRDLGGLINPDTGLAIPSQEGGYLTQLDLREAKFNETYMAGKTGTTRFSPLWQADGSKIQRMAPLDFIGRYMKGWWDYSIADELHQLAGDTAQGNGLGVLARCAEKLIALTGTLMGGYADDLFNIFFRMEPRRMVAAGYEAGSQGRRDFQEQYGVLETVEKVRETDNACSKAQKRTVQVLRKPGASPLLFGKYLMESTAFITLEDISDRLPSYEESVLTVGMDGELAKAYEEIEKDITSAMKEHRGNKSLMSVMLNTLLLYPDHPFGIEEIWGKKFDPKEGCMVPFFVTKPPSLPETEVYPKEERLIEDIRQELKQGAEMGRHKRQGSAVPGRAGNRRCRRRCGQANRVTRHCRSAAVLTQAAAMSATLQTHRPDSAAGSVASHVRQTLWITAPIALALLSEIGMGLITTLMLGGINDHALAAGAFASNLFITALLILQGALSGVGVLAADRLGAGRPDEVPGLYWSGVSMAACLAIPLFAFLSLCGPLLLAAGEPARLVAEVELYLHVLRWAVPAGVVGIGMMRQVLPALGLQRVLLWVMPFGVVLLPG